MLQRETMTPCPTSKSPTSFTVTWSESATVTASVENFEPEAP